MPKQLDKASAASNVPDCRGRSYTTSEMKYYNSAGVDYLMDLTYDTDTIRVPKLDTVAFPAPAVM